MRLIEHNIPGLRIAGSKRPGQQQWNKITQLPRPLFTSFYLSFCPDWIVTPLNRRLILFSSSFFSFLFVIVFFALSVHSFGSKMRYLSFFPAVLSALTGAIGAFAQGTSGQNAITYPLGGSLDGNAPLTITWTPTTQGTITINLLKGPPSNLVDLGPIAASINNGGTFTWTIPSSLQDSGTMPQGDRYGFKIIDDSTKTFEYSPPFDLSIPGSTFGGATSSGALSATASPTTMTSVSSVLSSSISATPTPTPTSTTSQESTTSTSDSSASTTTQPPAPTSTDLPSDILPNSVDTSPQSTLAPTTTSATPTPSQSKVADTLTPNPPLNVPMIIGASAGSFGGLALLIVAVVVFVKCRKRRSRARARAPLATAQPPVQSMRGYDMYNRV